MTSVKSAYENFDKPSDIVDNATLDRDEKFSLLNQWREDEEALIRSASEGLEGGEGHNLRQVQLALKALEKDGKEASDKTLKKSLEEANFETMAHQAKSALGG